MERKSGTPRWRSGFGDAAASCANGALRARAAHGVPQREAHLCAARGSHFGKTSARFRRAKGVVSESGTGNVQAARQVGSRRRGAREGKADRAGGLQPQRFFVPRAGEARRGHPRGRSPVLERGIMATERLNPNDFGFGRPRRSHQPRGEGGEGAGASASARWSWSAMAMEWSASDSARPAKFPRRSARASIGRART